MRYQENPLEEYFQSGDIRHIPKKWMDGEEEGNMSGSVKMAMIGKLRNELPAIFSRQYISEQLGGLITAKTLSNLDALNQGPKSKRIIGRKVAYERDDFLDWLEKRLQNK